MNSQYASVPDTSDSRPWRRTGTSWVLGGVSAVLATTVLAAALFVVSNPASSVEQPESASQGVLRLDSGKRPVPPRADSSEASGPVDLGGESPSRSEETSTHTDPARHEPAAEHELPADPEVIIPDHVDVLDDPGGDALRWESEPVNTDPVFTVETTPEHPVEGDHVTVRVHWSDAESDTAIEQHGCQHEPDSGICFTGALLIRCPAIGVQPLPPPTPGRGTIDVFSFTAQPGQYSWDRSIVLTSVAPTESDGCMPPDPYEDEFFASGVIDIAPGVDEDEGSDGACPSNAPGSCVLWPEGHTCVESGRPGEMVCQ